MKNKLQYIMAGVGITLLVILGAFTLLLPQAQADVVSENSSGEIITAVESVQSNSSDVLPLAGQNEPEQAVNTSTEAELASLAAAESPTESLEEAFLTAMGTKDNPQTNMDFIIHTVSELARKQEDALLGKPGWIHVQSSFYIPDEFRGNGTRSLATDEILPKEELVPNSPQTENWYHVNEEGIYHEGIGLITNPDGVIHQQSILWNGQWTNLTLKANSFAPEQYIMPVAAPEKVLLPIARASQQLEVKLTWSNVEMQATMDGDQYIVVVEQMYNAPIEDAIFMPEPVIGSRETFIFDVDTGQLSIEAQALLESQTWLFIEKWEYEPVEFVAELPDEPAQLFNSALNDLQTDVVLAVMGTKDTPQTNMDIIVSTVLEMAQKQEAALLGKPGWLHIKTQLITPEGQRGNGYHSATTDEIIPREVLVPDEPIFESWYHVDENGMYQEALSLVTDLNGTIYQQSVLIDSTWINLTLKALDTHPGQYRTPTPIDVVTLPVSEVYQVLAESQARPDAAMQAYLDNGQYVVVREERHDPIEDAAFMPEPVIGGREIYYFDPETGRLLFSEVHSILQSETLISGGETTYLAVEFLPEMPAETSQLFNDLMAVASEEE